MGHAAGTRFRRRCVAGGAWNPRSLPTRPKGGQCRKRSTTQRPKSGLTSGILPGDFAYTLSCGHRRIGIVGLNTTFLQLQEGDYERHLVWDARQLHQVSDGAVDDWVKKHQVCLLLTHQGPDWLTPQCASDGEREIAPAGRFAAHLFGHMHQTKIVYLKTGAGEAVRRC